MVRRNKITRPRPKRKIGKSIFEKKLEKSSVKKESKNYDTIHEGDRGRGGDGGRRGGGRSKRYEFNKINDLFTNNYFIPRFGSKLTPKLETKAYNIINDKINPLWKDIQSEFNKGYDQN